jgi:plastocyanin
MDARPSVFRSPRRTAALLGLLVLPLAACSSGGGGASAVGSSAAAAVSSAMSSAMPSAAASSGSATAVSGSQIVIDDFKFSPSSLTVSPGQKVTVMNKDSTTHTLTATSGKAFDTGDIASGASGSFTAPSTPGSYPYICTIHQFMHGTLVVK